MKEIKIKTDIGVFVFGATNFVNDVEADRINLKKAD